MMIVSWFSAGISSFVATWLTRERIEKIIYIHIEDQHPDSMRFVGDAEKLLGKKIEILQSPYKCVDTVIRAKRFIKSPKGAACTRLLKKQVRKEWEAKNAGTHVYVWGMDSTESVRAEKLCEANPEAFHEFPLISAEIDKFQAHGLSAKLGLKRPAMYDMGYSNNNCVGCVKGGMGYWNRIRVDFPDVFRRMAEREREIGHRCLKECFLDELAPNRGNMNEEIIEDCGIMCQLAWEEK